MTSNITNIIIAASAVIGLVPLGIASIHKMIKSKQQKKTADMWATIGISVFLSLIAPGALESGSRHISAIRDALPDWVKAAIPEEPPAPATSPGEQAAAQHNGAAAK